MSHERLKASDFPQEVLNLFDKYIHGDIDRRSFLDGAKKFAFTMSAAAMLDALRPNFAMGQQVAPDDPRLKIERPTVQSPNGNGRITGVLARPANATGKLPAILVIHENRGLNPHIEDIARRLALENYMAFAPDGLTTVGGYPGDEQKAAQVFRQVDQAKMRQDFIAAAHYLKSRPDCDGKLGCVGFCFGGGIVNFLAVELGSDLDAGVAFYGTQPAAADVPKIQAPLLLNYADAKLDTRVGGGWPAYEAALKANGKTYEAFFYEGANHGFNNDTGARYDPAAAKLAWQRTLDHFKKYLH